ncbi:SDR family oxidoreductase [Maritimibacter dapengensis]|uniref:SDR family oxidoreductase n=1 Tax=Maritimibacter dapengensis TaxID=2836868 RepID=A0ABS6T5S5_9RHOB|nr:SDR family oxidoreductase [Maritimibacter dapengensis]MBV7380617.1 SDR family oxidoreductase [Maritimibacter dapengensis]
MEVAVIGAGGFVGQRLSDLLQADPEITKVSLVDRIEIPSREGTKVETFKGDFSEEALRAEALGGADAVILLASVLGGAAEADYSLARKVNVEQTLDLFEYLSNTAAGTRVVFASTIAVYGKPMPDPVTDSTPFDPSMIYGAQKLMMEVALTNFTRRGWLDGVSIRPSGVMARDGADAALKSAFMSRLFWCVRRGEDIALPVAEDSRTWMASVDNVARNFVHAAKLPKLGDTRAFTLPALALTFGDLVAALRCKFPESRSRITYEPDPELVALFGSYPELQTETADRLGFLRDDTIADLIDGAI